MISYYAAFLWYFLRALASKKSEVVDVVMNDNNNDEDDMTAPAADTESQLNYAKKNRVWDLVMNEYFRWLDDLPVRSSRIQNLSLKVLQFEV